MQWRGRQKSANEQGASEKAAGETLADMKLAGDAAKEAFAHDEAATGKAARGEEKADRSPAKKGTPPSESLAESKLAAPAPLSQTGPAKPAAVQSAVESPPPAIVASKAPAAPKALAAGALASGKRGMGEGVSDDVDPATRHLAKARETNQLMNGTGSAAANAAPSSAAAMAGSNGKGGQAPPHRFAGPMAAATVVHLDVSALAVRNKVFENLLAQQGLGSEQNSANPAHGTPADRLNRRSGQLEQGSSRRQPRPESTTGIFRADDL